MPRSFDSYLQPFAEAREQLTRQKWFSTEWVATADFWPDAARPECVALKLQRTHWTNDTPERPDCGTGLFFSVWVDESFARAGRMHYNIHALKLRRLSGHALESRKFAAAFRARFQPFQKKWPNVSTAFGPQTLMEGWVEATPTDCVERIATLAKAFQPLAGIINALLREKKKD